jgi:hypothetical protein
MQEEDNLKSYVLDWEQSHLSQKDYCESNEIDFSDFKKARTKLIESGEAKKFADCAHLKNKMPNFIPVSILTEEKPAGDFPVEPAESNITEDNKLEVILPNGIILRMPIHAGSS